MLLLASHASALSEASSSISGASAGGAATGGVILVLLLAAIIMGLYFLPGIIASFRKHHNALPIWLVNIFLGWSFIGWVAALIWAFTAKQSPTIVHVNNAPQPSVRPTMETMTAQQANDEIATLKAMKEAGTITDAEFDEKRAKILSRVG